MVGGGARQIGERGGRNKGERDGGAKGKNIEKGGRRERRSMRWRVERSER